MARFHESMFRYWKQENNMYVLYSREGAVVSKGYLSDCKSAISCDLAWLERREADSTVIMSAFLTPESDLLIDMYITKKGMRPDEFAEHLFTMEARLRGITGSYVPTGFEKAMLEKVTQWILRREMKKRNRFITTVELKWESDKVTRIETVLQPRYAQNVIYHKQGMGELEHQLLRFPSGTHDDIIDAEQGVCRLLQFPKKRKKVHIEDTEFEFWRNLVIRNKRREKKPYVFGNKRSRHFEVPHTKTFR
jgi:hypothetical protein